jgi:hypothetical protein
MSETRLRAKFMDCVGAGARPLAPGTAEQIVALVLRLEEAPEIETLMALLH